MPPDIGTFAGIFVGLYVAHGIADHYIQTDHQAATKGQAGWPGRLACARHVAGYTACTLTLVVFLWAGFGLDLSIWGVLAGQAISAVTHYWADRRFTLEWFCESIGHGNFYRLGKPRDVRAWTRVELAQGDNVDVDLYEPGVDGPTGWDNPSLGTGAYVLDQWWHIGWLFVAAFVTVVL